MSRNRCTADHRISNRRFCSPSPVYYLPTFAALCALCAALSGIKWNTPKRGGKRVWCSNIMIHERSKRSNCFDVKQTKQKNTHAKISRKKIIFYNFTMISWNKNRIIAIFYFGVFRFFSHTQLEKSCYFGLFMYTRSKWSNCFNVKQKNFANQKE